MNDLKNTVKGPTSKSSHVAFFVILSIILGIPGLFIGFMGYVALCLYTCSYEGDIWFFTAMLPSIICSGLAIRGHIKNESLKNSPKDIIHFESNTHNRTNSYSDLAKEEINNIFGEAKKMI